MIVNKSDFVSYALTAIRELVAVDKSFVCLVKSNIANSKLHKIFELKCVLNILDWAFLVKSAE